MMALKEIYGITWNKSSPGPDECRLLESKYKQSPDINAIGFYCSINEHNNTELVPGSNSSKNENYTLLLITPPNVEA